MAPRRRIRSRGLRFFLSCDNWVTRYRCVTFNEKEPETLDWIDHHFRDGDLFLDAGANVGIYSIYAALRNPSVRVLAVEPEYSNLHLLRDNIAANHLQDRITSYALALSAKGGLSYLHVQDLTPGAAMHTEAKETLERTRENQPVVFREGIVGLPLDQFCEELGVIPNCVKIDVDGNEWEIFEGGRMTFSSPTLRTVLLELSEASPRYGDCVRFLADAGFIQKFRKKNLSNQIWIRENE